MPVYEVQTEAGTFQVEAANEQALAQAVTELPQAKETSFTGLAKSAGAGLVEGGASLLGLPADAIDLLGRMTGRGEQTAQFAKDYGSEAMTKRAEGLTGKLYEPQTGAEQLTKTAFTFAPGLVGGGASLPVKIGTRMALPAAAVEGAKALTEGTALEPYAPIAGAIGGLGAGIAAERALAKGAGVAARPTKTQIDQHTSWLYNHPEVQKLEIRPAPVAQFVDDAKAAADLGVLPGMRSPIPEFMAPSAYKAMDKINVPAANTVRVAEMDGVRKLLGEMAGEVGSNFKPTPNALAARHFKGAIDDFLANLNPAHVVSGDANLVSGILKEARASAQTGFKLGKVERIIEQARNTAAATHSGGNLENEIYKKVRTYLNDPQKHLRGWSQDEIAALRRVLPSLAESVLRRGGKILGGGGGLGQLASGSAGGAMFGFPGMVALPAAGMAMNRAGSALANRRMNQLMDLIASGAPSYAPHRAAYQASLQGPGLLGNLPSAPQASLYAALMAQRPQYVDQNRR